MATLILQYAGAIAGGAVGGPVGAMVGRALGSLAGAAIDERLFGAKLEGPRLSSLQVLGADEGQPVPALWGRARLAGQVIWAAPIAEHRKTASGGKGGPSVSEYSYTASFAVGLCEGPVTRIGRIWADGNEIDPALYDLRLHKGDEGQLPDSLIAAREADAPAYRGLAYVVFSDLPLGPFGNRVPQLTFEVFRGVDSLAPQVTALRLLPGLGEFTHDPQPVWAEAGPGRIRPENQHGSPSLSDWQLSMAQLQGACAGLKHVRLDACWFATALDAGACRIRPAAEAAEKLTNPASWSVAGQLRAGAALVAPGRMGTPDDSGLIRAITDLRARGRTVLFAPGLQMDVPGSAGPSAITAASRADANDFFARYGAMVLHYALLCAKAGGVDSFLIGSGLSGLIRRREADGTRPAVEQLASLARAVKNILPAAKIGFGAQDGDHMGILEALWAAPQLDFIGIESFSGQIPAGLADWWRAGPQMKPVWLTALGCPAVNAKGVRDDETQRRALARAIAFWREPANHPPGMVEASRIYLQGWDVRPYPAFPRLTAAWPDGRDYATGFALNGRLDAAPLCDVIPAVLARFGLEDADASAVKGAVDGFLIDRPMSAREALENLLEGFGVEASEEAGRMVFRSRGEGAVTQITDDRLVEEDAGKPLRRLSRAESENLPNALRLAFMDPERDYQPGAVEARRRDAQGRGEAGSALPVVMLAETADMRAAQWLQDAWAQRDSAEFTLPPSLMALAPGDCVRLDGSPLLYRITQSAGFAERRVLAKAVEPSIYEPAAATARASTFSPPAAAGPPALALLDLPLLAAAERPGIIRIAAAREPWTETLALLRREGPAAYRAIAAITKPATLGVTLAPLARGPCWRLSRGGLQVKLSTGSLRSVGREELLGGANAAAIGSMEEGFEILQFEAARLVAEDTYALAGLLRGQFGSEPEMRDVLPAGSLFLLLDDSLADAGTGTDDIGRSLTFRAGPASRDPADAAYAEATLTPRGRALRPLRPAHLRARRTAGGIALSWMRRTRGAGDSWDIEPPLNEEAEAWSVEVRSPSGEPLHKAVTASAQFLFPAPAPGPAEYSVRLAQLSASFGPGAILEETIHV